VNRVWISSAVVKVAQNPLRRRQSQVSESTISEDKRPGRPQNRRFWATWVRLNSQAVSVRSIVQGGLRFNAQAWKPGTFNRWRTVLGSIYKLGIENKKLRAIQCHC
jgi:hypothetical protein